MNRKVFSLAIVVMYLSSLAIAQQQPAPSSPPATPVAPSAPVFQLDLRFTISRFVGDKKISSSPYAIAITGASRSENSRLRVNTDVPYQSYKGGTTELLYRTVGTSIDCFAWAPENGLFTVVATVSDASVVPGTSGSPANTSTSPVSFRSFVANGSLRLRDGQTGQLISATDPITGEVMKVDVMLTVGK